jgi:phosphatidylglycerophosphate synthase
VFILSVSVTLYLAYGTKGFRPTIWGKLTTVSETLCVSLFLLFNLLRRTHWALDLAVWTTLALLLISGFDYLRRTVRRVRAEEPQTRSVRS